MLCCLRSHLDKKKMGCGKSRQRIDTSVGTHPSHVPVMRFGYAYIGISDPNQRVGECCSLVSHSVTFTSRDEIAKDLARYMAVNFCKKLLMPPPTKRSWNESWCQVCKRLRQEAEKQATSFFMLTASIVVFEIVDGRVQQYSLNPFLENEDEWKSGQPVEKDEHLF
jgi:hypothetical protein